MCLPRRLAFTRREATPRQLLSQHRSKMIYPASPDLLAVRRPRELKVEDALLYLDQVG